MVSKHEGKEKRGGVRKGAREEKRKEGAHAERTLHPLTTQRVVREARPGVRGNDGVRSDGDREEVVPTETSNRGSQHGLSRPSSLIAGNDRRGETIKSVVCLFVCARHVP